MSERRLTPTEKAVFLKQLTQLASIGDVEQYRRWINDVRKPQNAEDWARYEAAWNQAMELTKAARVERNRQRLPRLGPPKS